MAKVNLQAKRRGWAGFIDVEGLTTKGDYPFRYKSEYEDTIGRRKNSDIKYGRVEGALFNGGFPRMSITTIPSEAAREG